MMAKYIKFVFMMLQFVAITFLVACNNNERQMKFDKVKWKEKIDPAFPSPYRDKMLDDLISNQKLTGLKYDQLTGLLGEPDLNDSSSLSYKIVVDYGSDIDPVYTKGLDFTFSKDSTITSFKIDEWKKK